MAVAVYCPLCPTNLVKFFYRILFLFLFLSFLSMHHFLYFFSIGFFPCFSSYFSPMLHFLYCFFFLPFYAFLLSSFPTFFLAHLYSLPIVSLLTFFSSQLYSLLKFYRHTVSSQLSLANCFLSVSFFSSQLYYLSSLYLPNFFFT